MSSKHSAANRAKWAKIPKEKRSAIMSERAKARMKGLTPLQRKRIARKLVNAREAKRV